MNFGNWVGFKIGRLLANLGFTAGHRMVAKIEAKVERARTVSNVAKTLGLIALAVSLTASTCAKDVGVGIVAGVVDCAHDPVCRGDATPRPTATPVASIEYCALPGQCGCYVCNDTAQDRIGLNEYQCANYVMRTCPTPTPTIAPTPTPTGAPTATPSATPIATVTPTPEPSATPFCVSRQQDQPVSMLFSKRCPGYLREVAFVGDPRGVLCALNLCGGGHAADGSPFYPNDCTWWRVGDGLRHGDHLQDMRGAVVKHELLGGRDICVDAYGQRWDDCDHRYPSTFEDGERGPWTSLGYPVPPFCEDAPPPVPVATPTPIPVPTPADGLTCDKVEATEHWIVGGGGAHGWHTLDNNRVFVVVDSTVRPICDTDHMNDWGPNCGFQSHDPAGYNTRAGSQDWTISGKDIVDLGPNCDEDFSEFCNSAQHRFSGPAGGEVTVRVCLKENQRTDRGCQIPLRGNHCNETTWTLPGGAK